MIQELTALLDYGDVGAVLFLVIIFLWFLNRMQVRHDDYMETAATNMQNMAMESQAAMSETASALGMLKEELVELRRHIERDRRMIKDLYEWHNHTDSDGVRSWFTPRRELEAINKELEKLSERVDRSLRGGGL